MFTILRGVFRLFLFVLVLTFFVTRLVIVGFFKGYPTELGLRHRKQCCYWMIKVLGIDLTTRGTFHHGNYLFISNHRAYLDPVAQLHDIVALPVAKAEVAKLPIMGFGARISGVHFVQRESAQSRKDTRSGIADTIKSGHSILIYPEGTTIKTPTTGTFKPGTFHMAANSKVEIVPVAIEYGEVDDAWVGPESMPIHFFRQFGKRNKKIRIHYGDPMWHEDGDELLRQVQDWIDQELISIRKEWGLPVLENSNNK